MKITPHMRELFREEGKRGGKKRWEGVSKEDMKTHQRAAAKIRWDKHRLKKEHGSTPPDNPAT